MDRRRHQSQTKIDFDRFVAETAEPLLRSAYLITWDFAEAEDLVQEFLFKVARRWPRIKEMERPVGTRAPCSSTLRWTKGSGGVSGAQSSDLEATGLLEALRDDAASADPWPRRDECRSTKGAQRAATAATCRPRAPVSSTT